jgi:hypothetical protein
VDGYFAFAEASLCGAEYGMRLCVLVQSIGDEACPELGKSASLQGRSGNMWTPQFHLLVLINKDGVTSFPGIWCDAGSPLNNEVFCISAGCMHISSKTIPSGPGNLLLLRILMHLLKALLSSIEECGQFLSLVF